MYLRPLGKPWVKVLGWVMFLSLSLESACMLDTVNGIGAVKTNYHHGHVLQECYYCSAVKYSVSSHSENPDIALWQSTGIFFNIFFFILHFSFNDKIADRKSYF